MQSQQPHDLLGTCLISCATTHHLYAPPLFGYAGREYDGCPAEAACTRRRLLHCEFVEDRPDDGEGLVFGQWER